MRGWLSTYFLFLQPKNTGIRVIDPLLQRSAILSPSQLPPMTLDMIMRCCTQSMTTSMVRLWAGSTNWNVNVIVSISSYVQDWK